jgi:valyl-tRNA synthetase
MTETELSTRYDPKAFEQQWYEVWERRGYFTPRGDGSSETFSIVIPPPNVTGRLHLGHALVNTLQDVLVRWKRMSGYDTLWVPGVDHAGIATQMVVERELMKEGVSRHDLGRERFLERVWAWKEEHGDAIVDQLKRLGVSCDWTRSHFTLDEDLSRTVRHVFVRLYEDGLVYRDSAMVNWCPRCHTAISDLEVDYREIDGNLWHLDYPVADREGVVTVATTRPETMLGDTGVAVHSKDPRYAHLHGSHIRLPLVGREIPVVIDDVLVDPEYGTGVVKVTPAHDRNDYEAGNRNGLERVSVIDELGRMTAEAGKDFEGLDRFEARELVVETLRRQGLLRKVEPHRHSVGFCSRCDTVAEPMISTQWFVKIAPLAEPAIEAVRSRTIELVPENWESTYFNWMENIHDWCISRQLWWGHRIPAWFCECGRMLVAEETPSSCGGCDASELRQDPDVLDTWFSSALWPFSTMGWPEKTSDFDRFYPTSVLVTGFDILFFWVARMIMMGLRFTGKEPFSQVYLHGLVRDEHGQKMSKTKGNVIDPLEVIDEFGADAVRFTLSILSTGRDIPLAKSRMQGYAAFANKIWNASRFALMNLEQQAPDETPLDRDALGAVDRWILSRLNTVTAEVNRNLGNFRFDEAAHVLYHFFWHELCDWYIEMAKPVLTGRAGSESDQERGRRVLLEVFDRSLRLLHPFMPFITEEIWQKLVPGEGSIMVSAYPAFDASLCDERSERVIEVVQQITTHVRNLRAERGLTPADRPRVWLGSREEDLLGSLGEVRYLLIELARLDSLHFGDSPPEGAHRDVVAGVEVGIVFPEQKLTDEQVRKIATQIEDLSREIETIRRRLGDEKFTSRAPREVVDKTRQREKEYRSRMEALKRNLAAQG